MTRVAERLFALVRATLRNRMDDASLFEGTDAAQSVSYTHLRAHET